MNKHEIIIFWSKEDDSFIAEAPELPGCMADGKTPQEALSNAEIIISEWVDTAKELGRKREDALLEAHKKYIDIQLVLAGTDEMGWKSRSSCKQPSGEYDQETDVQIFADEPDAWLSVRRGAFAIFFPEDAHMPLISSGRLHKVVAKVAVDQR